MILYDVATGVRMGTPITIADDHSDHMALSIHGRGLIGRRGTRPGDRASQIWDLDPEHWAEAACNVAGRNLTHQEWAATIGELAPYRLTARPPRRGLTTTERSATKRRQVRTIGIVTTWVGACG